MANNREIIKFELVYEGGAADEHLIDLYDVSQALIGFQRSIALTCHLIINGEIITQAPALKGAQILAHPADEGSWKMVATVLAGIYMIGTAPKDTPLGHIVYSAYDYIVSESLGIHVDYDKSLGELFEEYNQNNPNKVKIEQHKLDSLMEKCNTAITDIHRPIFKVPDRGSVNPTPLGGRVGMVSLMPCRITSLVATRYGIASTTWSG